ncbi:MAG TPA: hypothetical protein VGM43_19595 [Bryobacteraceae bacterium]
MMKHSWRVAGVLAMKGWLETRWRLVCILILSALLIGLEYHARHNPLTAKSLFAFVWVLLLCSVMMLAGSGVKSQATTHISFPEGLAQSTQFTISLPVSRKLLLTVRAGVGLCESFGVTAIIACAIWVLFPSVSGSIAPDDFVRLGLTMLLWLPLPYSAALLAHVFLAEPLSFLPVSYGLTLLLWLLHKIGPAVDVVRAFGALSPLATHQLPMSQLATAGFLTGALLLVAIWAIERREY